MYIIERSEVVMKTQVARWGNSTAVRLPKAIVEQLGLQAGQMLEISTSGGAIELLPIKTAPIIPYFSLTEMVADIRAEGLVSPEIEWPDDLSEWPEYENSQL